MIVLFNMEIFNLNGKISVVTGALGKLGYIWVKTLLEAGSRVAALDLPSIEPPISFLELQNQFGADKLKFFKADITEKNDLEKARWQIEHLFGKIDILVNNAGIDNPPNAPAKIFRLEEIPSYVFKNIFDVNVIGAFSCAQVFGQSMAEKGGGSIINIGSLYASVSPDARNYNHLQSDPPFLKPPAYGASKAALINLTKYLATHLAHKGIRVNALSPGGVEGGQDPEFKRKFCERVPMSRMAKHSDLCGPLVFLASDASVYITGENLKVDGGFTLW